MKAYLYIAAAAIVFSACAKQAPTTPDGAGQPVRFGVELQPFTDGTGTRAAVDPRAVNYPIEDYFEVDDQVNVSTDGITFHLYTHDNGVLSSADDPLRFPDDGSAITDLFADWPSDVSFWDVFPDIKDQSAKAAFLHADFLSWGGDNISLKPSILAPVTFGHVCPKVTFTLGGIYQGRKITALEIAGRKAFCDPGRADIKDAQYMVTNPEIFNDEVMAGTLGVLSIEGVNGPVPFKLDADPDVSSVSASAPQNHHYLITINL